MARKWIKCKKCGKKYPKDVGKCSCEEPEVKEILEPKKPEVKAPEGSHKCSRCGEVYEMVKKVMNCPNCGAGSDWGS